VPHMTWTNERVVLLGHWRHGFCAFAAIAATAMVGRIRLVREPGLKTNQQYGMVESFRYLSGVAAHATTRRSHRAYGIPRVGAVPVGGEEGSTEKKGLHVAEYNPPHVFAAGEEMGWFEVGSGIVMVFEAPRDWSLVREAMTPGHSFKLGDRFSSS
jgi:phosphatidylserine decarboxylase